ncbi:hypothetical protein RUM43_003096 [Polyplax serrata]|uniref:Uncharacterized protein n=1 Tax=Polyplax serrata TaxID=468196 RepID=A0AAN8NUQ6_POLSC
MTKYHSLIVSIASICGLVQSIIWLALSIFTCLIYLCATPVAPYVGVADFFRVTFVKLYFEGPKCPLDGGYLGKFNDEYKTPEKINLMTPDIVFTILVVKIVLDLAHVVLCILLYRANKSADEKRLGDLTIGWSILVLVMSSLDSYLSIELFIDVADLTKYIESYAGNDDAEKLKGIEFIPLFFGLISFRVIVFWFWNVFASVYFICKGLCFRSGLSLKGFSEPKQMSVNHKRTETVSTPVQTVGTSSKRRLSDFKTRQKSHSAWDLYSMEAVTRFNEEIPIKPEEVERELPSRETNHPIYGYEGDDEEPEHQRPTWDLTNEAYVSDEPEDRPINWDFYRKIQKFEEGLKTIKMVKRPLGKPVRVPIPPPFPKSESFSC